jgi:hypothetical protein
MGVQCCNLRRILYIANKQVETIIENNHYDDLELKIDMNNTS